MLRYLQSCFLLLIPILVWNLLLWDQLPQYYQPAHWDNIPPLLSWSENALRVFVFALPILMKLEIRSKRQKAGLWLYIAGAALYFSSWLLQVLLPGSTLATSVIGISAPAWTTLFWLVGIGLIGRQGLFAIRKPQPIFIVTAIAFWMVHTAHSLLVAYNLQ